MIAQAKFSELLDAINGIVEHRVEAVLREVSKTLLIDLPEDETVSLDAFVARQDKFVRSKRTIPQSLVSSFRLNPSTEGVLG